MNQYISIEVYQKSRNISYNDTIAHHHNISETRLKHLKYVFL